jgi:hypothetical protein
MIRAMIILTHVRLIIRDVAASVGGHGHHLGEAGLRVREHAL